MFFINAPDLFTLLLLHTWDIYALYILYVYLHNQKLMKVDGKTFMFLYLVLLLDN